MHLAGGPRRLTLFSGSITRNLTTVMKARLPRFILFDVYIEPHPSAGSLVTDGTHASPGLELLERLYVSCNRFGLSFLESGHALLMRTLASWHTLQ